MADIGNTENPRGPETVDQTTQVFLKGHADALQTRVNQLIAVHAGVFTAGGLGLIAIESALKIPVSPETTAAVMVVAGLTNVYLGIRRELQEMGRGQMKLDEDPKTQ